MTRQEIEQKVYYVPYAMSFDPFLLNGTSLTYSKYKKILPIDILTTQQVFNMFRTPVNDTLMLIRNQIK